MKNLPNPSRRTRFSILSAIGAIVGFAAVGLPAQADEPPQISVSYADLNIDSSAGLKTLYWRLQTAAQNVCRREDDGRRSPTNFRFQACYKSSLAAAVAEIDKPSLTAMHVSRQQSRAADRRSASR
jgi:UrcA family protein